MTVFLTASLIGNARTIPLSEWHLASKRKLLLPRLPPQRNPRGMRKPFLAIAIVSCHNWGRPDRQCPIAIGSQRCLHGMRTLLVLVASP